jgi:hypothetical protein
MEVRYCRREGRWIAMEIEYFKRESAIACNGGRVLQQREQWLAMEIGHCRRECSDLQ